ncbi:tetraacyldisaccharide 4'-kinase [candidate division KSB1 bacterium]|nr:tetraacyldisaccharide 4'-kinase [candidate division KSB1 bacterium]
MTILKNKWLRLSLLPLSLLYSMTMRLRNFMYDHHVLRSYRIESCNIISVGNISVGGTGKTPMVEYLASLLLRHNKRPAILSRGYKRKTRHLQVVSDGVHIFGDPSLCGDEPYLLALNLPSVPVVTEKDRVKGAAFIAETFSPDFIILDDGFQHRRIQRDLDLVLIDASQGVGNGLTLPSGILREPLTGLRRADGVIMTRIDQGHDVEQTASRLHCYVHTPPMKTIHRPIDLVSLISREPVGLHKLIKSRVLIFSGIGNPISFKKTVTSLGADVVNELVFPDHHSYIKADIDVLNDRAERHDAAWIVTTEKDAVRLFSHPALTPRFVFVKIALEIIDRETVLIDMLKL